MQGGVRGMAEKVGDLLPDVSARIRERREEIIKTRNSGKSPANARFPECKQPCFACDEQKVWESCGLYRQRWPRLLREAGIPSAFHDAEQWLLNPPQGLEASYRAVQAYLDGVEKHVRAGHGLLFQGDHGTSKTSLACAVGMAYLRLTCQVSLTDPFLHETSPLGSPVLYLSALDLSSQLFSLKAEERDSFEKDLAYRPLLIFDDLGYEQPYADAAQVRVNFLTTFVQSLVERRHRHRKAVLFTTNLTPGELNQIYNQGTRQRIAERNHPIILTGSSLRKPFRLPGIPPQ